MPLFRKIIRNGTNDSVEKVGTHDLDLRHVFWDETGKKLSRYYEGIVVEEADDEAETGAAVSIEIQTELIMENARQDASNIVETARRQAAAIMDSSRQKMKKEAEKIKGDAARQGYDEGYKTAIEAANEEAMKIRSEARLVLEQAEQARQEQIAKLKDEILDLALEISQKILVSQLEIKPEVILDIAREAIQLVSNRQYVVLWVNPEELDICNKYIDRLVAGLTPKAELQIMADSLIEKGGCVVETDFGKVDATVSARWDNLIAAVKGEAG